MLILYLRNLNTLNNSNLKDDTFIAMTIKYIYSFCYIHIVKNQK